MMPVTDPADRIAIGAETGGPSGGVHRRIAELCIVAGADQDRVDERIAVGKANPPSSDKGIPRNYRRKH